METTKGSNTKDRELLLTRVLDAPIELVWEVWTDPKHIAEWWGPIGFTTTINKMDMHIGGEWLLIMHGPDGRNYDNASTFTEIVHMKKIVFEHTSYPKFLTTLEFEAQGEQTHIKWHMVFETKELFDNVVNVFGADKGQQENVVKLQEYLKKMKI